MFYMTVSNSQPTNPIYNRMIRRCHPEEAKVHATSEPKQFDSSSMDCFSVVASPSGKVLHVRSRNQKRKESKMTCARLLSPELTMHPRLASERATITSEVSSSSLLERRAEYTDPVFLFFGE